jgi:hypothetical protein
MTEVLLYYYTSKSFLRYYDFYLYLCIEYKTKTIYVFYVFYWLDECEYEFRVNNQSRNRGIKKNWCYTIVNIYSQQQKKHSLFIFGGQCHALKNKPSISPVISAVWNESISCSDRTYAPNNDVMW